jgi:PAS domain S-box-containing protein
MQTILGGYFSAGLFSVLVSGLMITGVYAMYLRSKVRRSQQIAQSAPEIQRLNRALSTLSRCNEAVVHATDEVSLLNLVCEILVQVGGYRLAWVGYADSDDKNVHMMAESGFDDGYVEKVEATWDNAERGRGPIGTAIKTGEICVIRDLGRDPRVGPWRQDALQHGYHSMISMPLREGSQAIGVLSIYASESDAFDSREVKLLEELAGDLAYGIVALRNQEERKEAQAQLHSTAQRLGAILDRAPVGIDLVDSDGRFLEVNPAFQRITGYSAEELKGMTFYDLTHPDDRVRNRELMGALWEGKLPSHEIEKRYIRKDGHTIWVRATTSKVDAAHTMGIVEDITERKEAAAQLQATAERLQAILEHAPVGIAVVHRDSRIVETNAAYERITGYSAQELKGTSFTVLTHPEDLARNVEWFDRFNDAKLPTAEIEKRYIRKDGQVIWARNINSRLGDDYSIGIVEDITARKQAEEQLLATANRLQAILEHAPFGIVTGDREGRFGETNAAFQRMTGCSGDELRQMSWKDLTHPDDLERNTTLVKGLMDGELQNYDFEKRYLLQDGRTIWVRVVGSLLDDEHKISIIEDISERKDAGMAMARLAAIVENSDDAIWGHTPEGVITSWNASAARLFGYTAEEMIGQNTALLVPADLQNELLQNMQHVRQGGRVEQLETVRRRKDGSLVEVSLSVSPILQEGKTAGSAVIARDVTKRKEIERALRSSEARFRSLIDTSIIGIYIAGKNGRISYANDAFLGISGYTRDDVAAGLCWHDLNPPEYLPPLERNVQEVLRAGMIRPHEKEYFRKDGSRVPVMVGATLADLGDTLVVFVVDLSERKEQQLELERLGRIVESADDAITSLSLDGIVLSWNEGAQRLLGYSKEEMIGKSENILLLADSREELEQVCHVIAGDKGLDYFRTVRIAKSGEEKPVWVRINPIRDGSGKIIGIAKIARDRSEAIRAQKLEEQLRQAQKLEAVGRLAGGVAHDFNNLLMVICSYTEMMQEQLAPGDRLRRNTQQVLKAAERGASLTQQMLAFSRKQVLSPVVLDLNNVVDDTSNMLKRLIGEDIELVFHPSKALWRVTADPSQIVQVLMNLSVNARDAMPIGGKLTIETRNVVIDAQTASKHAGFSPGEYIMLAVSDTGAGMSPEVQARVFEPFFTTKEQGKGTGLGLSTVYGIVKQSGGYIWVYSEAGKGSCFKLYFPRVEMPATASSPQPTSITERGLETVLVVEDDDSLREVVSEYLGGHGYRILQASDGQKGLEVVDHHIGAIDLVLTDVIMPKMSGPELAAKIASCRELATLFMSGYTDDAIVNHGILRADTAFIQKPFSLSALGKKVREVLDSHKTRKQANKSDHGTVLASD